MRSLSTYFNKYIDFLVLHAFIEDNPYNLDVPGEIDKFLAGLTHCAALRSDCRNDRMSTDPDRVRKYTQGQIVTTLTTLLQSHRLPNVPRLTPVLALLPSGHVLSAKPSSFCQLSSSRLHRWIFV